MEFVKWSAIGASLESKVGRKEPEPWLWKKDRLANADKRDEWKMKDFVLKKL